MRVYHYPELEGTTISDCIVGRRHVKRSDTGRVHGVLVSKNGCMKGRHSPDPAKERVAERRSRGARVEPRRAIK